MGFKLILALLCLALVTRIHADLNTEEYLSIEELLSVRVTFGTDIIGNWTRINATGLGDELCPQTINHTKFVGGPVPQSFASDHNTIIQDGNRCDSTGSDRQLLFYNSSLLDTGALPPELNMLLDEDDLLNETAALFASTGENFFVGYESLDRLCKSPTTNFTKGTVFFLVRPFRPFTSEILGDFIVDFKYQIAVPFASNSTCVFQALVTPFTPLAKPDLMTFTEEPGVTDEPDLLEITPGSPSPSPTPTATPTSTQIVLDLGDVCFPSDATVELEGGDLKRMDQLAIGDRVKTSHNTFSDVFMFTHKEPSLVHTFLRITTASGESLTLTPGHYLYLSGRLAAAGTARIGDTLTLGSGEQSPVTEMSRVVSSGLYNPQTLDGDIIVNGVVASTYTTTVSAPVAHTLLAPFRMAYRLFGFTTSFFDHGGRGLEGLVPRGAECYP